MSIMIDHEERRALILTRSLELFAEQGYSGVSIQKIAKRCGLTRTTLYKYFSNRREIFDAAIMQVTAQMEADYRSILAAHPDCEKTQLIAVMDSLIDALSEQQVLLRVILEYLIGLRHSGERVSRRITRHTYRLRHMLNRMLVKGMDSGVFCRTDLRAAGNALYGLLEAYIFQLTVTERADREACKASARIVIEGLCRK